MTGRSLVSLESINFHFDCSSWLAGSFVYFMLVVSCMDVLIPSPTFVLRTLLSWLVGVVLFCIACITRLPRRSITGFLVCFYFDLVACPSHMVHIVLDLSGITLAFVPARGG
ncbi:hypothetical protein B0H66DRAFT_558473 [Apodospora peruviana]|uniref:Uncharacterized protein n=1 Tax=Apodospora peruviana TaxID=516989 RepID=A0AAE0I5I2_9PEZI|nr:hypothetical protein B0H66DRAFT_558473 [Apodospora peruviana]